VITRKTLNTRASFFGRDERSKSVVLNAITLPWTAEVTNISIRPMQKSY